MSKSDIRKQAEQRIQHELSDSELMAQSTDIEALIHELRVHQIELELQNEALREAQQAQAEAEKHYFDLFQLAPIGYLIINSSGIIQDLNLTASEMLGTERENLVGRPLSVYFELQDRSRFFNFLNSIFRQPTNQDISLKMLPGLVVEYCHLQAKKYQQDDEWRCRLTLSDVTEKTRLALREEEYRLRYQSIFDYSDNAIVIYDRNLNAVELNRSAKLTLNRLQNTHINELMGPHWYTSQRAAIEQSGRIEGQLTIKDSKRRDIHFDYHFIHNLLPGYHMLILYDVTTQRLLIDELKNEINTKDQSLRDAILEQMEISKVRARIITTISHEFKTPLAIIQSAKDILQGYGSSLDDAARETRFNSIQRSVDRLLSIVNDVVEIERFNKVTTYSQEALYLPETVQLLIDDVWGSSHNYGRIMLQLEPDIPSIKLNKRLLDNILVNLIENALLYSHQDVYCSISTAQNALQIRIKDAGIGIPPDQVNRIFEPFYRLQNVENIPGAGLGLYIVKRSVEALNGAIDILSNETERGITAHVQIPI